MNSIPQAVKSQANPAGKIALSVGSVGGPTTAFTVKQLPSKVGTITGTTSNALSTPGAVGLPAAFIKINHAATATTAGFNQTPTTHLNTAAKIQIQPGVASSVGGGPLFSMTVNPPLLNSTTTGVKRKADQMENHTN